MLSKLIAVVPPQSRCPLLRLSRRAALALVLILAGCGLAFKLLVVLPEYLHV